MEVDCTVLYERINQLVWSTGKTQREVAELLHMTAATLSRYQSGKQIPDMRYLIKIATYFNVSLDWLVGISDDKFKVFPPDILEVANLYSVASHDDQMVIQAVLKKYKGEQS